MIIQTIRQFEG